MKIKVTQEHIDEGVYGECIGCVLSLAIEDHLVVEERRERGSFHVSVSPTEVLPGVLAYGKIEIIGPDSEVLERHLMTPEANDYAIQFDKSDPHGTWNETADGLPAGPVNPVQPCELEVWKDGE